MNVREPESMWELFPCADNWELWREETDRKENLLVEGIKQVSSQVRSL